jgi:hypothetical protein
VQLHASGALWLPDEGASLVADVHLGYAWAQRRRGELGPLADGGARERLEDLVEELRPRTLVFLGDLVHAPKPSSEERAVVEETIESLASRTNLVLVSGNHDRAFTRDYLQPDVRIASHWTAPGVVAIHGDRLDIPRPGGSRLILAHYHPTASLRDGTVAVQRIRVAMLGPSCCILPAFSPFAAGLDVRKRLPRKLRALFPDGVAELAGVTGTSAAALGRLRLRFQHPAPPETAVNSDD